MARPRILIAEPGDFSPRALAQLGAWAEVVAQQTAREDWPAALRDYDAVWFRLAHRIDAALLENATRCRVLATPVTGIDHIDVEACRARGIEVVCLKGETAFLREVRATAELTVGLVLALMRHIPAARDSVRHGHWKRDLFRGNELYGKTVGLVGAGRLGTITAGYFQVFGMKVIAYDPRPDFPGGIERVESLSELLGRSDVVSIHVSYSPATHHLLGRAELAAMKPGTWLVNTARGGVVDEAALLAALEAGHLAGAALDVLSGEPDVDGRHPVVAYARGHENVLVVPHIGGNTYESFEKTELFLAGKVQAALARVSR